MYKPTTQLLLQKVFTAGPFIVAAYFDDDAKLHGVLSSE